MILRKILEKSQEFMEEDKKLDKNDKDYIKKKKELEDRIVKEVEDILNTFR